MEEVPEVPEGRPEFIIEDSDRTGFRSRYVASILTRTYDDGTLVSDYTPRASTYSTHGDIDYGVYI